MYIKGFAISRPKIVQFFELDPLDTEMVERGVKGTIGWLDRDEFLFIACGIKDGTRRLVIVLDVDEDEDKLKGRPSKPLEPSLTGALPVLDGPDIWVRTA
jgi:hypothetical protein